MFIVTGPAPHTAKLRRSGMELMSSNDFSRGRSIRPGTCRSYGAWHTLLKQGVNKRRRK
jgi:hypothetical protein